MASATSARGASTFPHAVHGLLGAPEPVPARRPRRTRGEHLRLRLSCWGATIGGESVARSSLGIDARGNLIWAASPGAVPAQIAAAQIAAGSERAIELDINPDWVAGYVFLHPAAGITPVPLMAGQYGIAGEFLVPYTRDFFTVVAG